ncbi:solute carrier family 24 [Phakopsora pachyrhizi]|nr:solute carrier family 24 [Phakopsora pachyrhizi]
MRRTDRWSVRQLLLTVLSASSTLSIIFLLFNNTQHHQHLLNPISATVSHLHRFINSSLNQNLTNPLVIDHVQSLVGLTENDDVPTRIAYTRILESVHSDLRPILIGLMVVWLMFLFGFVGIVASDFFCPNLSTLSNRLGLNENLAGVTFLGFGNGAPDVFSTFVAMRSGTGSLAIGELIGAASFIVSVVLGSMCLIRPFQVDQRSFTRDLGFFTLAILLIIIIITDGRILSWEANVLMILYMVYVITVGLGTWYNHHRQSKIELVQRVRSEFLDEPTSPQKLTYNFLDDLDGGDNSSNDQLIQPQSPEAIESDFHGPFPLLHHQSSSKSSNVPSFQTLLESNDYYHPLNVSFPGRNRRMRAPSLSYRANPLPSPQLPHSITASPASSYKPLPRSSTLSRAASMSSSSQADIDPIPRRRACHSVARNSIRPGLLGAIEFRDVVNSLAKESKQSTIWNSPPTPSPRRVAPGRKRSDSHNTFLRRSERYRNKPGNCRQNSDCIAELRKAPESPPIALSTDLKNFRLDHSRAKSQSAITTSKPTPWELENIGGTETQLTPRSPLRESIADSNADERNKKSSSPSAHLISPENLSLTPEIPSILITAETGDAYTLPPSATEWNQKSSRSVPKLDGARRYFKWKKFLRVVFRVLFPSLKDWKKKSYLGKFVAVMSSPALLLLSLTLPVVDDDSTEIVETEEMEEEEEEEEEQRFDSDLSLIGQSGSRSETNEFNKDLRGLKMDDLNCRAEDELSRPSNSRSDTLGAELENERREEEEGFGMMIDSEVKEDDEEVEDYPDHLTAQWLAILQCVLAPPFCVLALSDFNSADSDEINLTMMEANRVTINVAGSTVVGIMIGVLVYFSEGLKKPNSPMKLGLCFIGFVVSMVWILSIVNEVVGLIMFIGKIFGISDSILGLTVFGVGNSLGDFVANITIAKMGFPSMAVSACFGGPMLNILMGIGFSSSYLLINKNGDDQGGQDHRSIKIEGKKSLMISSMGLLLVLVSMMVILPIRGFKFDRLFGMVLVFEYGLIFVGNLIIEIYF